MPKSAPTPPGERRLSYTKHIMRGGLLFKRLLDEGPQTIEQLAALVNVSERTAMRYMAAIEHVSDGIVHIRKGYRRDTPQLWAIDVDDLIRRLKKKSDGAAG